MSDVSSAEVVRALKAAKARIVKYGWVQGTPGDSFDGYCIQGALDCDAAEGVLEVAIGLESQGLFVWAWNDAPDRTLEDVLQAFDAAIELARGPR